MELLSGPASREREEMALEIGPAPRYQTVRRAGSGPPGTIRPGGYEAATVPGVRPVYPAKLCVALALSLRRLAFAAQ
jgi:hypothetical protein